MQDTNPNISPAAERGEEQQGEQKKKRKLPDHNHNGHRERLKDRFLREGLENFEEHNILELLLFYALPQKDTNEIAHELINRFHGLPGVLNASPDALMEVKGISKHSAVLLTMMLPLFRAYSTMMKNVAVEGRENIIQFICDKLYGHNSEKVVLVCMDNREKMISCDVVSEGSVNFSMVDKRKIVELVLRHNATSVIIAHNHPRGYAQPSQEDVETTMDVKRLLAGINVRLVDHIITSSDGFLSMQQEPRFLALFC